MLLTDTCVYIYMVMIFSACVRACVCTAGLTEGDGGSFRPSAGRTTDSGDWGSEGEPGPAGQSPSQSPHPGPWPPQQQAAWVWRWASEKHGTVSVTASPPAAGSCDRGVGVRVQWFTVVMVVFVLMYHKFKPRVLLGENTNSELFLSAFFFTSLHAS